jgi:hypothetical protein
MKKDILIIFGIHILLFALTVVAICTPLGIFVFIFVFAGAIWTGLKEKYEKRKVRSVD